MTALLQSPWRWPLLLALVCAVLASIVGAQLSQHPDVAEGTTVSPAPGQAAESPDDEIVDEVDAAFVPGPIDSYAETVERPLFQASRRPVLEAGPAPEAPAAADADSSIQLAGVVIAGGRRLALVQLEGAPRLLQVEAGGDVAGWKVDSILEERVVLRHGDKTRDITLKERMKAVASLGDNPNRPSAKKPSRQPERGARADQQSGKSAMQPPGRGAPQTPPRRTLSSAKPSGATQRTQDSPSSPEPPDLPEGDGR